MAKIRSQSRLSIPNTTSASKQRRPFPIIATCSLTPKDFMESVDASNSDCEFVSENEVTTNNKGKRKQTQKLPTQRKNSKPPRPRTPNVFGQKMAKKNSSKQNPAVATWGMKKKSSSKPPAIKSKEKPSSSTPKSFGQEIEEIFSKKRKKPEKEKTKKDEVILKKKKSKTGGSNVEMFESEQAARPKKKTADGLVIYSEEDLGIGKADAGGTRLCPFDCDCCF